MKEIPPSIPKGVFRESLRHNGFLQELAFYRYLVYRYLVYEEVYSLIKQNFKEVIQIENVVFEFLETYQGSYLIPAKTQKPNGSGVIELAKSGSLCVKYQAQKTTNDVSHFNP